MAITIEVGDKVLIKNCYGKHIVTITRVTKTKAVAHVVRNDKSSYDWTFQRQADDDGRVRPKPRIEFDTTERTLIKKKN